MFRQMFNKYLLFKEQFQVESSLFLVCNCFTLEVSTVKSASNVNNKTSIGPTALKIYFKDILEKTMVDENSAKILPNNFQFVLLVKFVQITRNS
jgi:hypothetical protein